MKKVLGMLACATLMLGGCGKKSDKPKDVKKEMTNEMAWGEYDMPDAYDAPKYVFDDKSPVYDYEEVALYDNDDYDLADYDELAWDDNDDYNEYELADANEDDYDFDEDEYDLAELDLDDDLELAELEDDYNFDEDEYKLAEVDEDAYDFEEDEYDLACGDEDYEFEPIQFAFDSDILSRGQEEALVRDIALAHQAVEDGEAVVIEAYGCQIGTEGYNNPLTQRRAEAMKKRFVAAGIPADKVIARGMGQERPVVWSDASERLQRIQELSPNRRVEISLAQ